MKIISLLTATAAFLLTTVAFALPPGEPPPPPPPPPPELNDCSPGFWKNHEEYWADGQFCGSQMCVEWVMAELESKGPGSGDRRHAMSAALNAFADDYYQALICTD